MAAGAAEPGRAGEGRKGRRRSGQGGTGQGGTGQERAGEGRKGRRRAGQGRTGRGRERLSASWGVMPFGGGAFRVLVVVGGGLCRPGRPCHDTGKERGIQSGLFVAHSCHHHRESAKVPLSARRLLLIGMARPASAALATFFPFRCHRGRQPVSRPGTVPRGMLPIAAQGMRPDAACGFVARGFSFGQGAAGFSLVPEGRG